MGDEPFSAEEGLSFILVGFTASGVKNLGLETIAAISTALGESGIGIVRVSGDDARVVGERVVRTPKGAAISLNDRRMFFGQIVHPNSDIPIDEGMILWMPGPHSYTAEDVIEFQVHGGVHLVHQVLQVTLEAGARLAEPGEFTKRAFLNGRMDLSQAEAVMDLIRAKTDFAGRVALAQVRGAFGDEIRSMRKDLIALQAHVEVTIDYPEHDVEDVACRQVIQVGGELNGRIERLAHGATMGRILRDGVSTAIVGRPNVGKSSLLNALLRSDRAIVTDIPGTTRDVLEEYVNVQGIPLKLIDTAGIRETVDVVERMGVERSRRSLENAELALVVLDGSVAPTVEDFAIAEMTSTIRRILVVNKRDKGLDTTFQTWVAGLDAAGLSETSAWDGSGVERLETLIASVVQHEISGHRDSTYMTNARQLQLLELAKEDVLAAMDAASAGATLDLIAVALQSAYEQLGLVIGEETGEDLLDEIFSRFCLGK